MFNNTEQIVLIMD